MEPTKRKLRVLTDAEQSRVNRVFNLMSIEFAKNDNILARNRYVDSTIADLLDAVQDTRLLLKAWSVWAEKRELLGVDWPVTKFETEMAGPLDIARRELAYEDGAARNKARQTGGLR